MHVDDLILTLASALSVALLLGIVTQRLGASPILGYLLAGVVVGPYTPGFVANARFATQLAEIGIILLMFGVGLHFKLPDLLRVRRIAVPGAIVQSAVATGLGTVVAMGFGWSLTAGLVLGMCIAVASTVVLIRMLAAHDAFDTPHGHVAVGWLIVEDIFTVLILLLVPVTVSVREAGVAGFEAFAIVAFGIFKLVLLIALVLAIGPRVVPWFLMKVARMRSSELFTLTVLAIALAVATGSAVVFGASLALGAFLAGMVVGQSRLSHQAAADALPMRDAFAVLFFVAVGMQFDYRALIDAPGLVFSTLGIILIGKPIAALVVVVLLGYSIRTALTVAIGLAQIGEFSFILADMAGQLDLFPPAGRSVLVASAILSIGLNPLLFRLIDPIEDAIRARPKLLRWFDRRAEAHGRTLEATQTGEERPCGPRAIVVGYGPVGRTIVKLMDRFDVCSVIIDLNIDTISELRQAGRRALYGDGKRSEVLLAAGLAQSDYVIVTTPDPQTRAAIVEVARSLNPNAKILVRAHYIAEHGTLEVHHATAACYEEEEVAVRLAEMTLGEIGVPVTKIAMESRRIRAELASAKA